MLASSKAPISSDLRDCGLRYFASNRRYCLNGSSTYTSFRFFSRIDLKFACCASTCCWTTKTGREANCAWPGSYIDGDPAKRMHVKCNGSNGEQRKGHERECRSWLSFPRWVITGSHRAHSYIGWHCKESSSDA